MLSFILRRLVIAIPTIILISVFVFTLQKLLPGDPVLAMAGEERDPQVLEFLREKYRLNDPIPVQYFTWIGNALTGDLGISLRTNQPVLELIGEKLPVTIQLATMAMIFALLIGVVFLKERLSLMKLASTMTTLLGAVLLRFIRS